MHARARAAPRGERQQRPSRGGTAGGHLSRQKQAPRAFPIDASLAAPSSSRACPASSNRRWGRCEGRGRGGFVLRTLERPDSAHGEPPANPRRSQPRASQCARIERSSRSLCRQFPTRVRTLSAGCGSLSLIGSNGGAGVGEGRERVFSRSFVPRCTARAWSARAFT